MPSPAIVAAAGLLGYVGFNTASYTVSQYRVNDENARIYEPVGRVSINIPAFREQSEIVEACFQSLENQNVLQAYPDMFEYVFTGVKDDPITDFGIPKRYTDKIVLASKRGKLLGRHLGIKASKGDIVVSLDSDCKYPRNWLNMMLSPLSKDSSVIGTTSSTSRGLLELIYNVPKHLYYAPLMLGRGSLLYRSVYFDVGGFDLSKDYVAYSKEANYLLWKEEEVDFRKRLDAIGNIVYVDAPIIHEYQYERPVGETGRGLRRMPTYSLERGKRAS